MLKKTFSLITFIFLIANIFSLFLLNSDAKMQQPELKKGYYWVYKTTWYNYSENNFNGNGISNATVVEQENIKLNGTTYNTWKIVTNTKFYDQIFIRWISYYNYSDIAFIKHVEEFMVGYLGDDVIVTRYNVPSEWPLENNTKITKNITVNYLYENFNITIKKKTVFECMGMVPISTDIGEFNCYKVKYYTLGEEDKNYSIGYWSSKVGWIVKRDDYKNGELEKSAILSYYHGHKPDEKKTENKKQDKKSPINTIFLIGILIFLTAFLGIIGYKYFKNKK